MTTLKILITGGCGFLGSQLALYLCERGHDVVAMDNLVRRGSESNIGPIAKARRHLRPWRCSVL